MSRLPQEDPNVKKEIRLTRLDYAHLYRLTELRSIHKAKGDLNPNGSIFQSSEQLHKWLKCTKQGLRKSRRRLIKAGRIKFEAVSVKGQASHYWILNGTKQQENSGPEIQKTRPPLTPERAKEVERTLGRDIAVTCLNQEGYSTAEIIEALGEPKHKRG